MEKKHLSVMIIEDDPADTFILGRYLKEIPIFEIELVECSDWTSCQKELRRLSFDIIFLDYLLGAETGLDILKKIRAAGHKSPVIVLTGKGDERIAAAITRAGASDYLLKSDLSPEVLRRSVSYVLDQYRLHREKALLTEQLQQSQKMETIGRLAGGIAHDFNNMLTAIMGYLELAQLKNRAGDVQPELEKIHSACLQMADWVQQLLSFSRSSGSERALVSLSPIIEDTVAVLGHTLPKNVTLKIDLDPDTPLVNANTPMLQQVIMNLSLNASEAMPEGGMITIDTSTILADADLVMANPPLVEGRYVLMEIKDTGSGIPAKALDRIFEPFFTTKHLGLQKGTGLGLSVVWNNVRFHGGLVTVDSRPGQGAVFKVYLPIAEKTLTDSLESAPEVEIPKGSELILVVDDEPLVLELVDAMLTPLGYTVHCASDGIMALETFGEMKEALGIILLDISMPHMDGRECLKRFLEIDPNIPVLIASGHDMTAESEDLISLGARGVIQKPYRISDLAYRVRTLLDG